MTLPSVGEDFTVDGPSHTNKSDILTFTLVTILLTINGNCHEFAPGVHFPYPSAAAFAEELGRFLRGEPIQARPVGYAERLVRWSKRNPSIAGLTVGIALILILATVISSTLAAIATAQRERANQQTTLATANAAKATIAEEAAEKEATRAKAEAERATLAERNAVSAAERATAEAERATAAEKESQLNLYFSNIALADQLLNDGQPERARKMLDACSAEFRHWEWRYLMGRCTRGIHEIWLPSNPRCAAYSEDGRYIAFGTEKGELVLWDSAVEKIVFSKKVHEKEVRDLAWHPNGSELATAGADGVLHIWSSPTLDPLRTFDDFQAPLTKGLAYSLDGRWLAATEGSKIIHIYGVQDGEKKHTFTPDYANIRGMGWTSASDKLCIGHGDAVAIRHGHVALYDALSGNRLLHTSAGMILDDFTVSRNGELYACCGNNLLTVKNITELSERILFSLFQAHFKSVALSSDGTTLSVNGHGVGSVVYDASGGHRLNRRTKDNYRECIHPQGKAFVSFAPGSQEVQIHPVRLPKEHLQIKSGILTGFYSDGNRVATTFGVYDSVTGTRLLRTGGNLAPNQSTLLQLHTDGTLYSFDASSGKSIVSVVTVNMRGGVHAYSKDGRLLGVVDSTGAIHVWDTVASSELPTIPRVEQVSGAIGFSPVDPIVAIGYRDGNIRLWDLHSATQQTMLGKHVAAGGVSEVVSSIAYSRDGRLLATGGGSRDMTIRLWDLRTNSLLRVLAGSTGGIGGLAFSNNGKRLASCGNDGILRLWHVETGRQLLEIEVARAKLSSVGFSPDDQQIAVSDSHGTWVYGQVKPRLPIPHGEPIDLLPWLRRHTNNESGNKQATSSVQFNSTQRRLLPIPLGITGSYSLKGTFVRNRSASKKTIGFLLPSGSGKAMLCFDHENRAVSGLDLVAKVGLGDPVDKSNPTNRKGGLVDGKTYEFLAHVQLEKDQATVKVTLNGDPFIDWTGPQSALSMWPTWEVPDPRMIGVTLGDVDVTLERLELIPHDGEVLVLDDTPIPPKGVQVVHYPATIDLLPLVDPQLDVFDGEAAADKELVLTSVAGKRARLSIPVRPLGAYELYLTLESTNSEREFCIGLPATRTRGAALFNAKRTSGIFSGIEMLAGDGVGLRANPASVKGSGLGAGRTHDVLLRVRPSGNRVAVEVILNDQLLCQWEGDQTNWTLWKDWEVPNAQVPFIGCNENRIAINKATLKMLDGEAWILRPRQNAAAVPAAELQPAP